MSVESYKARYDYLIAEGLTPDQAEEGALRIAVELAKKIPDMDDMYPPVAQRIVDELLERKDGWGSYAIMGNA